MAFTASTSPRVRISEIWPRFSRRATTLTLSRSFSARFNVPTNQSSLSASSRASVLFEGALPFADEHRHQVKFDSGTPDAGDKPEQDGCAYGSTIPVVGNAAGVTKPRVKSCLAIPCPLQIVEQLARRVLGVSTASARSVRQMKSEAGVKRVPVCAARVIRIATTLSLNSVHAGHFRPWISTRSSHALNRISR